MAPLKPHWKQPSHPEIQEVIVNDVEFTTKSVSKVALPPFGLFAKLEFPPCTVAPEPTYATVQMGRDRHLDLNSDLLYINHSCEPSLIFDMANMNVIAGPKGLQPGDELTFFYPSTEWYMAQPFDCLCGTPSCRGRIAGARDMTAEQLSGMWLNGHIRQLLEERERADQMQTQMPEQNDTAASADAAVATETKASENDAVATSNGHSEQVSGPTDRTVQALRDALTHAEKVVDAARLALVSYVEALHLAGIGKHGHPVFDAAKPAAVDVPVGAQRRGPTSRELSGEMGGDT
ncbi:uncharacterized protein B0T15DRAFT_238014 [Chaetomium strumarium]|uniref:Post-SET domain-containing protein n=1 Tax=Chaetomium strumarium TaxID=1170767 RepID=A0AAJ0M0D4_9PEZI|nr:hypothetical protein B0T15DRAFT_238014 [Chaetomium strumarium]